MDLSYVILGMLVIEISMVFWIFRWAHRSIQSFRASIIDLLSGESEESAMIIEKLGHTIYQKLYRYFNLKIPDSSSISSQEDAGSFPIPSGDVQALVKQYMGGSPAAPGGPTTPLAGVANMMGIDDPGFLRYLPLIEKFMKSKGGTGASGAESLSNGEYW